MGKSRNSKGSDPREAGTAGKSSQVGSTSSASMVSVGEMTVGEKKVPSKRYLESYLGGKSGRQLRPQVLWNQTRWAPLPPSLSGWMP